LLIVTDISEGSFSCLLGLASVTITFFSFGFDSSTARFAATTCACFSWITNCLLVESVLLGALKLAAGLFYLVFFTTITGFLLSTSDGSFNLDNNFNCFRLLGIIGEFG